MKISTFSIIAGTAACNASCPFCVSKMTGQLERVAGTFNERNFHIACKLAKQSQVTTAMITGKGEPTLDPRQIRLYTELLNKHDIPLIELQTNGILLADDSYLDEYALGWYMNGMTTIAISVVHYEQEINRSIYLPNNEKFTHYPYFDLARLVEKLHEKGFSVRVSCILLQQYANITFVRNMINYAQKAEAEQLTFVPLNRPKHPQNDAASRWALDNQPSRRDIIEIRAWLQTDGVTLLELPHGAKIYDVDGQNVCLSNCMGNTANNDEIRNLIFYPSGRIAYDWQYGGAIIL
jgi:molybdenum cofactor biosynthesis enzyme MoaA